MLLGQLQSDLAAATKARDQIKVDTLRFLLGAIKNFEIEKYPPDKGGQLTDEDVLGVVAKQVKSHKESIEMFGTAGRQELVEKEKAELAILSAYLPSQMTEEEIKLALRQIKSAHPGADFGTLMKLAMA